MELTYGPASDAVGETSARRTPRRRDRTRDAVLFWAAAFAVMKTDFYVRLPAKTADLLAEYLPDREAPGGFRRMIWEGNLSGTSAPTSIRRSSGCGGSSSGRAGRNRVLIKRLCSGRLHASDRASDAKRRLHLLFDEASRPAYGAFAVLGDMRSLAARGAARP